MPVISHTHTHTHTLQGSSKPKYVYKTVEELKDSDQYRANNSSSKGGGGGGGGGAEVGGVKVIDMTGPEKRVLSGYEEIHSRHTKPGDKSTQLKEDIFLPELLHNVELLVEKTEQEIVQTEKRINYSRDLVVNMKHEEEERQAEKVELDQQVDKLAEILAVIDL